MFFERRCPSCRTSAPALCDRCVASLVPAPVLTPAPGLEGLAGRCRYEGAGRAAVLALKHGGRRDLARWWARQLVPLVPAEVDVVTWVPASLEGRRDRGYDQAALLARALARDLGRPAVAALVRPRRTGSQRGRSRHERAEVTFEPRRPVAGRVLVVDDVVTTGASLSGAAGALRRGGAVSVVGLVIAVADRRP